jgi:chromosome condensin MukBEF MukE localization factor
MDNQEIEARILAKLPQTYGGLVAALEQDLNRNDLNRKVDSTLQRLRRRGAVTFERKGRDAIWMVVNQPPE